jgi:hypothetical protein
MNLINLYKNSLTLIVLNLLLVSSYGQKIDFVKVIPGQGIVLNDDSIMLYKTSVSELCNLLKINCDQQPYILRVRHWDGFDVKTGESVSGSELYKGITYKSILFEFSDPYKEDSIKLHWIKIKEDKTIKAYTDSGIELGETNPNIIKIYPLIKNNDYSSDDSLTYNLYTYGVSFQLERTKNKDLRVIEISTHYRTK